MQAVVAAGAGFLLSVLWFDLMFDIQVLRHRRDETVPEPVLASIAGYYRRVTTEARPMNRLVAVVMLATLVAIVAEVVGHSVRASVAWVSLGLAVAPIALAGARTVPSAVRLGARTDSHARQSNLARAICRDHLFCLACIASLLVAQLVWGR